MRIVLAGDAIRLSSYRGVRTFISSPTDSRGCEVLLRQPVVLAGPPIDAASTRTPSTTGKRAIAGLVFGSPTASTAIRIPAVR